ncbi:MAG: Gfo/Idh/MocA family oxidoreductase [Saprospiraceae bacterium]|nr:Gfo/Idh/MocA family oxidoreductase [Saprospiraceae bacterium]
MIRWGIIGLGKIARVFATEFRYLDHAALLFAASSDSNRAASFAKEFNIPHFGSYTDLLSSTEVDAVYIALPHNQHFEFIVKCLNAGKHVLCEKPITVNFQQLEAIKMLAGQKNLFVMEAMWTLFLPSVKKAKQWLNEGKIGKLTGIDIEFAFPAPEPGPKRLFDPQLAGGSLLDIGIYPITLCQFLMEGLSKNWQVSHLIHESGVDSSVSITLQYPDILAHLSCSFLYRGRNAAVIYGEKGSITLPVFWKSKEVALTDNNGGLLDYFKDESEYHGFYYEMQHANQCILDGKIQSDQVSMAWSTSVISFMDEVRNKIGLKYPFE